MVEMRLLSQYGIEWKEQKSLQTSSGGATADEAEVMELDEVHQPEGMQAGHFQLSLGLRRQLAKREAGMNSEAKQKREKMREKRNEKKLRNHAKKKLHDDERKEIRATLQSKSRRESMQQIVPSSRTVTPASKALTKKKSQKKSLDKAKVGQQE